MVIEPEPDGRPQRKYCTAAHRAVARQLRREGAHRSASAPPLPLPTPPLPLPPLAPIPSLAQRRRQLAEAAARRARAMAVLGSAGLLVTGGGLMAASAPIGMPGTTITGTPWLAATPDDERNWAQQAQVTLTSLEQQLDEVDQTERSWNELPAAERGEQTPAAVRALAARRALLLQQRATLQSELATWESMTAAGERLADTEAHVATLERALKEVPRNRQLSRPEADTAQQLGEQRSLRMRQRDSQREELDSLRQGLHEAMAAPLPDDATATKAITSRVTDLVKNPGKRKGGHDENPLTEQSRRPDITAQRDPHSRDRQDVGNGAPPNPGRAQSGPGRTEILAGPEPGRSGGAVEGTVNGLEKSSPRLGGPQPNAKPGAPGQNQKPGSLGNTLNDPGKSLNDTGKSLNDTGNGLLNKPEGGGPQPQQPGAKPNAPAGQAPGSERGRGGGLTDQPLNKPFERTSQDTFIGPSENTAPKSAPSAPRKSSPTPQTNLVPRSGPTTSTGSSSGGYGNSQKMEDASKISNAVGRGNMNDMVSSAMEARAHQNQAGGSSSAPSGSGYSGYSGGGKNSTRGGASGTDIAGSMMSQYGGMGGGGSSGGSKRGSGSSGKSSSSSFSPMDIGGMFGGGSGGSGGSKSKSKSSGGSKRDSGSSYSSGSSGIGKMIEKYSSGGGGGGSKKSSKGSSSKSSKGGGDFGSFFGSSGKSSSKSSKSYKSSGSSKKSSGHSGKSSSKGKSSKGKSGGGKSFGGFHF
ncbi:hypothetical protein [Pseudonocardia acaciae]|uniref:hypothetical protein n=1 Tax=Pseudonocardia acaciae TaxID=551276 RepID=UPI0012EDE69F|nr:hypothetical protein [Pseudonocardia acaciae]